MEKYSKSPTNKFYKIDSQDFSPENIQELGAILSKHSLIEFSRCGFNQLNLKILDNLSHIKFKKCVFTNDIFEYMSLRNIVFNTCSILNSKFFRVDLEDIDVSRVIIRGCDFEKVNIFEWVTIAATAIKNCSLNNIKCYGQTSAIVGNLFSESTVKHTTFYSGNFSMNQLSDVVVDAESMRSVETRSNFNTFKNSEENDYSGATVSLKGE